MCPRPGVLQPYLQYPIVKHMETIQIPISDEWIKNDDMYIQCSII